MRVVDVDSNILSKLNSMDLENQFLNTFKNSDFLVIEEENEKIIGVCGVGGIFHIGGIFVLEEHRGSGLGSKLNQLRDKELKERGYSFFIGTTYTKNPHAKNISHLLDDRKAEPIFSFVLHENFITTLFIQEFNTRGKIIGKLLSFFNTKFGTFCLAIILKSSQKLWNRVFLADSKNYNGIDIRYSVNNFKKIMN
tara:strand:+ start:1201 stop:1785 length:585 start_codon:yes stop_codon:yes gene_type:complete